MATTKAQKIEALSDFLESHGAVPEGHSLHDGPGCQNHGEAFGKLAGELLELVEDNYGYAEADGAPSA